MAASGSDSAPVEAGGEDGVNEGDRRSSINVKQYLKTLQVWSPAIGIVREREGGSKRKETRDGETL